AASGGTVTGNSITGGTLAFGTNEGLVLTNNGTTTLGAALTNLVPLGAAVANGLTVAGAGTLALPNSNATNGSVNGVLITSGGSGYVTAPTVTFSAPTTAGGVTATGTAVINAAGVVTAVLITNAGSGYTAAPTVTFSAGTTTA